MKVLHVLASNKYSGAENVVCQIIKLFKNEDNIEMAYCSVEGPIRETLSQKDINFFGIEKLTTKNLKKIIKTYQPDIIHAHDMKASFICSFATSKIPVISHIHNNAYDSRKFSLKSIAYLVASKKIAHIFWVSNSSLKDYKFSKMVAKKSSVLENVIDVAELYEKIKLDNNEYSFDVIFLGRLSYPKNPHRLLDVCKLLKEKLSNIRVAIVGSGELEEEIHEYFESLGLNNNVKFFGYQSNPMKILWQSKVMLMTSRWEGLPMCVLEAMALNVKIVCTPLDGVTDTMINDKKCYFCQSDDELANKAFEIISSYRKNNEIYNIEFDINDNVILRNNYKNEISKIYNTVKK